MAECNHIKAVVFGGSLRENLEVPTWPINAKAYTGQRIVDQDRAHSTREPSAGLCSARALNKSATRPEHSVRCRRGSSLGPRVSVLLHPYITHPFRSIV